MSQSKLRFSIEESVWLKKGQEVAEVISMSLNPDITINEENGQVYIKGALVLQGEYQPAEQNKNAALDLNSGNLQEKVSYRSLTQLNIKEDGIAELTHRFPVDITIPSYRVEQVDSVTVLVESFDYELPNPTCLELSASICIKGIREEKRTENTVQEEVKEEKEESFSFSAEARSPHPEMITEIPEIFAPFQFESRQVYEPSAEEVPLYRAEEQAAPRQTYSGAPVEFKAQGYDRENEQDSNMLHSLKSIAHFENTEPVYEAPQTQEYDRNEESYVESAQEYEQTQSFDSYASGAHQEYEAYNYESYEANERIEEGYAHAEETESAKEMKENPVSQYASNGREENALYLTRMLAGKEENFSKMKMYILQRGDSLDNICSRYDISLNSLLRLNRIQQDEVQEGQIIYIPVSR